MSQCKNQNIIKIKMSRDNFTFMLDKKVHVEASSPKTSNSKSIALFLWSRRRSAKQRFDQDATGLSAENEVKNNTFEKILFHETKLTYVLLTLTIHLFSETCSMPK